MNFRVGQKVVCVAKKGDGTPEGRAFVSLLIDRGLTFTQVEAGKVYTIATINCWPHATLLTFEEIDNSHIVRAGASAIEPGWPSWAFRPVKTTETGMKMLREILDKPSKKIRERV